MQMECYSSGAFLSGEHLMFSLLSFQTSLRNEVCMFYSMIYRSYMITMVVNMYTQCSMYIDMMYCVSTYVHLCIFCPY